MANAFDQFAKCTCGHNNEMHYRPNGCPDLNVLKCHMLVIKRDEQNRIAEMPRDCTCSAFEAA